MTRRDRRWWRHPAVVVTAAYAAGSIPFSNLMARRTRGVDLRGVGTGTVSGTSLYDVAGFVPLAVAGVAEVAKGAIGPLLAGRERPQLAAAAAAAGVCGHDWSPWLGGAGGRGLSPSIGALLPAAWPGGAILLGGMAAGRLAHRTSFGSFLADLALVPVLGVTRGRAAAWTGAGVIVPMVVKRLAGNHSPATRDMRTYVHRLVFDEDPRR